MERRDAVRGAGDRRRCGASRPCRRPRRRRSRASTCAAADGTSFDRRRAARSPSPRTAASSPGPPATPRRAPARSTCAPSTAWTRSRLPGTEGGRLPVLLSRWTMDRVLRGRQAEEDRRRRRIAVDRRRRARSGRRGLGRGRPDRRSPDSPPAGSSLVSDQGRRGHAADHAAGGSRRGAALVSVVAARRARRSCSPVATSPVADAPGDLAVVPLGRDASDPAQRRDPRRVRGPGYLLHRRAASDLQAATFDERTLTLDRRAPTRCSPRSPAATASRSSRSARRARWPRSATSAAGTRRLDRSRRRGRRRRRTADRDRRLARLAPRRRRDRRQQQLGHLDGGPRRPAR